MPMSARIARAAGGKGEVFAHLPIASGDDSELHRLAADSISCTVCHQIAPDKLGTRESFNGEFVMLPTPPDGARVIFGPFQIDAGRKTIMRSVTGFEQAEGAAHQAVGAVRVVPHADHAGVRTRTARSSARCPSR